jgi:hypothetical protein
MCRRVASTALDHVVATGDERDVVPGVSRRRIDGTRWRHTDCLDRARGLPAVPQVQIAEARDRSRSGAVGQRP